MFSPPPVEGSNTEWGNPQTRRTEVRSDQTGTDGSLRVVRLVKPRERDAREINLADGRQKVRDGMAKVHAAKEEKEAFDALT